MQPRKHQRTDMKLRDELAGRDQTGELRRPHELNGEARFAYELRRALRFDEERVDAVAQPSCAGRAVAQAVDGARQAAGLFQQFAAAACGRVLAGIDHAGRQLPGERLGRRPVLPYNRDAPIGQDREDRNVIGLLDRVIDVRGTPGREFDLACDDAHPRRYLGDPARADLRPCSGLGRCGRLFGGFALHACAPRCHAPAPFKVTVSGGRRSQVVAKA